MTMLETRVDPPIVLAPENDAEQLAQPTVDQIYDRFASCSLLKPGFEDESHKSYGYAIAEQELLTEAEADVLRRAMILGQMAADMYEGELDEKSCLIEAREAHVARYALALANLRLVPTVVSKYVGRGVSPEDLVQQGNIGLMRAAEKTDASRYNQFSTYAYKGIEMAVRRTIENQSRLIRVQADLHSLAIKLAGYKKEVESSGGFLDVDEAADFFRADAQDIRDLLIHIDAPKSFEDPLMGMDELTVGDTISDPAAEAAFEGVNEMTSFSPQLSECMNILRGNQRRVITLIFGIGGEEKKNYSEVGKILGISRQAVQQAEARALKKMRDHVGVTVQEAQVDLQEAA